MVDPCICPVCGGPLPELPGLQIIDGYIFWCGRHLYIPKLTKELFIFLYNRRNRFQSVETLILHLYGDDPEGGPEANVIPVYISRIRKLLRDNSVNGLQVETSFKFGYCLKVRGASV